MLILSRKPRQSVVIGNDIKVTVLRVRGKQIRLGIKAPRELPVDREEVQRRKLEEKLHEAQGQKACI